VAQLDWYSDMTIPYGQAMVNLGFPANYNPVSFPIRSLQCILKPLRQDSGDPFGNYNSATAINRTTGKRSYAANTYYAYNAGRSNLVVLTGAQATKINFANATNGGNIAATGVSFVSNSTSFSVRARKEVILSAGAFCVYWCMRVELTR
jgi:choline dehydrogenase-like flavoprotein